MQRDALSVLSHYNRAVGHYRYCMFIDFIGLLVRVIILLKLCVIFYFCRIRVEQVIGDLSRWAVVRGSTRRQGKTLVTDLARIDLCRMAQNFTYHARGLGKPWSLLTEDDYQLAPQAIENLSLSDRWFQFPYER